MRKLLGSFSSASEMQKAVTVRGHSFRQATTGHGPLSLSTEKN